MEMRRALLITALFALLLPGCGREDQPPPPKLFESQRNALDKAQGLQDQLQQQSEQQSQEIDRQTSEH
jgi:hypothetical protein